MKLFNQRRVVIGLGAVALAGYSLIASAAVVLTDSDGVIRQSLCVGFDCPNNPSFGFDTIRLQENNLRIHFEDTSEVQSFPRNDWRILVNENANGGLSKFSIQDVTNSKTPFTIEANARNNSLYVEDGGRVGIGTGVPVLELHVADGDTPALRLEQNGTSGFTPQTWDVAGNETNFFIRDVNHGSTLPFRIFPDADSNSLTISAASNVGVGIQTAAAKLHVRDTEAKLFVQNNNSTTATRTLLDLENNGSPQIRMKNTSDPGEWLFAMQGNKFALKRTLSGDGELVLAPNGRLELNASGANLMTAFPTGNMTIAGTLTELSDAEAKQDVNALDGQLVLSRLQDLPVNQWRYSHSPEVKHAGPMAQDFYAAFGLGPDNRHISARDMAGVNMAAIKAQQQEIAALRKENASLRHGLQSALESLNNMKVRLELLERHQPLTQASMQ